MSVNPHDVDCVWGGCFGGKAVKGRAVWSEEQCCCTYLPAGVFIGQTKLEVKVLPTGLRLLELNRIVLVQ